MSRGPSWGRETSTLLKACGIILTDSRKKGSRRLKKSFECHPRRKFDEESSGCELKNKGGHITCTNSVFA